MQYWELVTRSFRIAWRHKYLWLIALFAGEAGGGFNFSFNQQSPVTTKNGSPDFAGAAQTVGQWLNDHLGLIVFLIVLFIVLWIVFFVLAAICEGATVRASAEHDAERPFGLGVAWRCGLNTMGSVIRLRLLIFVLVFPPTLVVFLLIIGTVIAGFGGNAGAALVFGLLGGLGVLALIPYVIYVSFVSLLGIRAIVLEQLSSARAALSRGHRLARRRLGRVLLVWLLSVAVGIVVGIAVGIAFVVVAIPVIAGIFIAGQGGNGFGVLLVLLGALILIPVSLVVSGFLAAQGSTYWTLAFRRLDLEPAPAPTYYYPYAQPQQPGPAAPPQGMPPG